MNIIGFYEKYCLVEQNGVYNVVNKSERKTLFSGTKEESSKVFILLISKYVSEGWVKSL